MPKVTRADQLAFLEHIRGGDDRPTAAHKVNVQFTGNDFKRLCNPQSEFFDEVFAEEYTIALFERGPLDPRRLGPMREHETCEPSRENRNGTKAPYITDEQIEQYLDLIREGIQAHHAAQMVEPPVTSSAFTRRANKDPVFAQLLSEAKADGYPALKDRLRAEAERQAFAGDYKALRDMLMIHVEEYAQLRTTRHEIGGIDGGAIRMLAEQHFPNLTPERINELIRELEGGDDQPKELSP